MAVDGSALVDTFRLVGQMGGVFVIAAVCPEAQVDEREFKKAGDRTLRRLEELEEE